MRLFDQPQERLRAEIGVDLPGRPAGEPLYTPDRWGEQWPIRGVADVQAVVDDGPVFVVYHLAQIGELDRLADAALLYRAGTWAQQAHEALRSFGGLAREPLTCLGNDRFEAGDEGLELRQSASLSVGGGSSPSSALRSSS